MSFIWDYGFTSYDIEISEILEEIDVDLMDFIEQQSHILLDTGYKRQNTFVSYSDLKDGYPHQTKSFSKERVGEIKSWLERNEKTFLPVDFHEYSSYLDFINDIIHATNFPKYKLTQVDKDVILNDVALFTLRDNLIKSAVYDKKFRKNEQFIELCIEFYGREYYEKYIEIGILGESDANSEELALSISDINDLASHMGEQEYKNHTAIINQVVPNFYFFKEFRKEFLDLPIKYVESQSVENASIKINKAAFLRHHVTIAGLLDSRDGYYIYEDSRWGFGNNLSWQNEKEAVVLEISALIRFKLELLYAKFNQIVSEFEKQHLNIGLINRKATLSYLKRFYNDLANSESHYLEFLDVIDLPAIVNKKITKVIRCIIDYQIDVVSGVVAEKILIPSQTKGLFFGRMDLRKTTSVKVDYSNWSEYFVKTKINWEIEGKDFLKEVFSLLYKTTDKDANPLMTENDVMSILENNFSCYEGEAFPFNPKPKPNSIDKWVLRQFIYDFYDKCGARKVVNKDRLVQFLIQNFEQFSHDSIESKKELKNYASYIKDESCSFSKRIVIPQKIFENSYYRKFILRK